MIIRSLFLASALVLGTVQAKANVEFEATDGETTELQTTEIESTEVGATQSGVAFDGVLDGELHDVALRDWFPRSAIVLNPFTRTYTKLPNCGGSAELEVDDGQVNIVFRNVEQCSKFDILSTKGESINYGMKSLSGRNGNRRGSFTLPQSVIEWGRNGVMVQIRSNSGKTMDKLYLDFYAL